MSGATWAPPPAGARFRIDTRGPVTNVTSELNSIPTPGEGADAAAKPWNPANPLFWFGVIAATTFGLMAFSTSVRVGAGKASVSLGK